MAQETFHDQWSPGTPVRWSPADSKEADAWLSLDDAARRIRRSLGCSNDVIPRLVAGEVFVGTFASYRWEAQP